MFEEENIDSQTVVVVSIFGALAVFVAIILIQVIFYRMEKQDGMQKASHVPTDLADYEAEQTTAIGSYRYIDKSAGSVAIPIEQAMRLTRQRLAAEQSAPSAAN